MNTTDIEDEWSRRRLGEPVRIAEVARRFFLYVSGIYQGMYFDLARVDDELKMIEDVA